MGAGDSTGGVGAGALGTRTLSDRLATLRRGFWIICLVTVVTGASAYFFSERQQRLYQATADVVLSTQNLAAELSNVVVPTADPARDVATQAQVARSPTVAEEALRRVPSGPGSVESFLSRSSVRANPDANLLTFVVTDPSRSNASRLATAYASSYTDYRRDFDTRALTSAKHQVLRRLQELKAAGGQSTDLYASLSETAQRLQTMTLLLGSNATVVRSAGRAVQVQPSTARNTLLGLVLGLLLGCGLVFLRESWNGYARDSDEVARLLGLPLLARVPSPTRKHRSSGGLEILATPDGPTANAFYSLATNIEFANRSIGAKSILVTSSKRDEGKSTTVASLGTALARRGRNIVLVDLDLRRPSQGRLFNLGSRPGVSDVLVGTLPLTDVLCPVFLGTGHPMPSVDPTGGEPGHAAGSLVVIPVGTVPPNPSELELGDILRLLEDLPHQPDLVLLDGPPILGPSEALALCGKADALLVVSKLPNIKRHMLEELRRVVDSAPIAPLGLVATGSHGEKNHGYGYGYGYG